MTETLANVLWIGGPFIMQIRGYYARPWASGDADVVKRVFVCECGGPACEEELHLTIGEATAAPVLDRNHAPP
jgi:hypothetical protein